MQLGGPDGSQAGMLGLKFGGDLSLAQLIAAQSGPLPAGTAPGTWTLSLDQATVDSLPNALLAPLAPGHPRRLDPNAINNLLIFTTYLMMPGHP